MKVGSTERTKIDVRMIAATNENLEENMKNGKFREDLFYRLHVFPIFLPDLKDRKEDIPLLAYHFFDFYSKEAKKKITGISKEAMKLLLEYHWPGNVRELENLVKKIVVFENEEYALQSLDPGLINTTTSVSVGEIGANGRVSLKKIGKLAAQEAEKQLILKTLLETRWNRKKAADLLEISYKALLYKIKQAGLSKKRITI